MVNHIIIDHIILLVLYLLLSIYYLFTIDYFFTFFNNDWKKMTTIDFYQPKFSLKSLFNYTIVRLAQIFRICFLTMSILSLFVLNPSFFARLNVYRKQKIKLGFQKIVAANKNASTI